VNKNRVVFLVPCNMKTNYIKKKAPKRKSPLGAFLIVVVYQNTNVNV